MHPQVPLPQLAARIPIIGLIHTHTHTKKFFLIDFISGSRQSKHSFKEHITACSPLEIHFVSTYPLPGIALPLRPAFGRKESSDHPVLLHPTTTLPTCRGCRAGHSRLAPTPPGAWGSHFWPPWSHTCHACPWPDGEERGGQSICAPPLWSRGAAAEPRD